MTYPNTKRPTLRITAHLQFAHAYPQAKNCKRAVLPHPRKEKPACPTFWLTIKQKGKE